MPRLYYQGERFDEISPNALMETEFEALLIQNAGIIRKDTVIVPFKKTVYSPEGSARADLAMISTDYRDWVVIEVEMSQHDLYRHVIPQVRKLQEARYTQEHVTYIHDKCPVLDKAKLSDMMRGDPPDILVIVNKPNAEWRKEMRRYGAHMMVFEIFRSDLNKTIFVIDGEAPKLAHRFLSKLSFGMLPRCLMLSSPAALPVEPGVRFPVLIEEQITYWERFHTSTCVYLTPVGKMPIDPGREYALIRFDSGEYSIRPQ
ncbi:MAG: hypothetical protein F4Y00_06690 [Bacteroidetes bacterium SB0662_bin_6]|nr:hypothetical protein [Bacteroidetes bacterium SB0668_bin_1]MYE04638.1 hypothetical protein [Bacteroidetes bacterium SB0662_bin_6]